MQSTLYLDIHGEVVCEPVEDHVEGGAGLLPAQLVVGDPVAVPVPRLPQPLRVHAAPLDLVQQTLVNGQIALLAVL